jgi:hypothetical protein
MSTTTHLKVLVYKEIEMSVTVKYEYLPVDPTQPITRNWDDWVNTLNDAEQAECRAGEKKYNAARQLLVEQHKLVVKYNPELTYEWANQEAATAGVPTNSIHDGYRARYLSENNAKLETVTVA